MDTDHQADEAWILSVQRKLYQWSQENPGDQWRDMWGWLTDIRTLRYAWRRVASNRGARTPGVDGMTVGRIRAKLGEQRFLEGLQAELRSGTFRPLYEYSQLSSLRTNRGITWEENAIGYREAGPQRLLIDVTPGFHAEAARTASGDPLIVCNSCDTIQAD